MISRKVVLSLLFSLTLFLDILSKQLVEKNFYLFETSSVIPGFFNITYVLNPGSAFGMLQNQSEQFRKIFFLGVTLLACVLIAALLVKEFGYKKRSVGYVLILAGAMGNLVDRMRTDKAVVVDFLDFYIKNHHWYTFNLADSVITIGVGILLLDLAFTKTTKAGEG